MTQLIRPSRDALDAYVAALEAGWSPANVGGDAVPRAHLAAIRQDADAFFAGLHDPEARGAPISLPDGSTVPRLPAFTRWIWDGAFCGAIHLRWQNGTDELPPHVLGHVGYTIVPWKRGHGHATRALALLLPEARAVGLRHVDLTTDPGNAASQRVITANGGLLVGRFTKDAAYGNAEELRFRIGL
ncbi:GNAT family N-acetyltransferase [Roseomonas terrae]|uniref:GNAT family N-acetyltransferase n=1 Tax=Neoroseomonas terrae TaxID=424799 RepID=A0ABS5EMY2_9PROT|nr:GNAT family N-acetyltransferase [Neoroseomonas terrae]MBR0652381.1 GNAT family N-acetyltransferase [Neoroseomonas terrae]